MNEYVGIRFLDLGSTNSLKREAIFFDRVGTTLSRTIRHYKDLNSSEGIQFASELEWLTDQGFLFDTEPIIHQIINNIDFFKDHEIRKVMEIFPKVADYLKKPDLPSGHLLEIARSLFCRLDSVTLRQFHNMDAFPIIDLIAPIKNLSEPFISSRKAEILRILLNALPVPNDSVPWEQIFDYRKDPDSKERALSLRRWINKIHKVSDGDLSVPEIQDEAQWLMHQYQNHMNLHKMKVNLMTLEAIIKAPLEVLENLVRIKWSKLPDPLFTITRRKIAILDVELNAPGRELSYIIKAKHKFEKH